MFGFDDLHNAPGVAKAAERILGPNTYREDCGTVSLIGEGITADLSVMNLALKHLEHTTIHGASTSRFRMTFILPAEDIHSTVRTLHEAFGLAHPSTDAVLS